MALLSSAVTLVVDEEFDARRVNDPEQGIHWEQIGDASHESVIVLLLAVVGALALYFFLPKPSTPRAFSFENLRYNR